MKYTEKITLERRRFYEILFYDAGFKRDVTCFVVADSCNDKGINPVGDDTCSPSPIESSG